MLFLHDTEGLAWKLWHHRLREASAMPNPHDKSPILVTESEHLLLPMHQRFLCVLKCASQVTSFQTKTFLHLILSTALQFPKLVQAKGLFVKEAPGVVSVPPGHNGV